MDRTVLIFIAGFGIGQCFWGSLYRSSIPLRVLEISFVQGIVTMGFQPIKRFLSQRECNGIPGQLVISCQRIDAKGISIGLFAGSIPRWHVTGTSNQGIESAILFVPHLVGEKMKPRDGSHTVI